MWVWRDGSGRIASVTGSIHQKTLDWLRAEDEWNQRDANPVKPAEPAQRNETPWQTESAGGLSEPKPYDAKADWVEFVVAKTANTADPVSHADADALTKAELIELYGGD